MTRKAIALEAYMAGKSSREAASLAGMSPGYVRVLTKALGISHPVGRPRKYAEGWREARRRRA